jgi:hypothetical protein
LKKSVNNDLYKVVKNGNYLQLASPEGKPVPCEIGIVVHNVNEVPKATVTLFVNLDELG